MAVTDQRSLCSRLSAALAALSVVGTTSLNAQAAAVQVADSSAGRTLSSLPGVAINYYDVSGSDIRSIDESILTQQGDQISTSAATWDVGLSIDKRSVGAKCEVVAAKVNFSAAVRLPRLVNEDKVKPDVRAAWRKYVGALEARQAADLWFVHDHLAEVEQAVRSAHCEDAGAAASGAIAKIKSEEAGYVQGMAAPAK